MYHLYEEPSSPTIKPRERSTNETSLGTPLYRKGNVAVYDQLTLPPIEWSVEGLIKQGGHHLLVGATGSMKSFLTIDLASRLANGMGFHGYQTKQCDVLYVVGEGLDEIKERMDDWQSYHNAAKRPFINPIALQLHDYTDMNDLVAFLQESPTVGMLIFDTLSNCSTGVKINEPDEVTARLNPTFTRLNAMGITTFVVHHTNKDLKTMRGAQALIDHTDKTFMLTKNEDTSLVTLKEVKVRRGVGKQTLFFKPESTNETAVLLPVVESEQAEKRQPRQAKVKQVQVSTKELVRTLFGDAELDEVLQTKDIVAQIDRSERSVKDAIKELCEVDAFIAKVGHGSYRRAA